MTDQPTIEAPPYIVQAQAGTKLDQLHAAYFAAKSEADGAAERLKAITDALKLELTQGAPAERRITLAARDDRPALALTYAESWRVDSRKLKAEDPETYVRYAKKSGSWSLRVAGER